MLSTEGVLLLLLKRTVNPVFVKYFLILVMTQQIYAQSSVEGYAEAYRVRSEKGGKEGTYKDAYKADDGTDYTETVEDMHQVLDKDQHKEDSHEHDKKGNHKDSKRGKTKAEPNKMDQDYDDDYEYQDEPDNEAGYLDPEVESTSSNAKESLIYQKSSSAKDQLIYQKSSSAR